jgi:phosphoglucosamine mutase
LNRLFGTDGIRGIANRYPLDCETAIVAGRAIAAHFSQNKNASGRFLIGRDTRISGSMLASALAAGICSMGNDVHLAGVIPTPAVAYLAANHGFDAGIVISASHNPFTDNGIKLFGGDGFKLSDAAESSIEKLIGDPQALARQSQAVQQVGRISVFDGAASCYCQFLENVISDGHAKPFDGTTLVIDGSNGAASEIASALFRSLGATVKSISCTPDGININDNCGSQHPQALARAVVDEKADAGLAFDGDADRLIAVDETGTVLSGDQVMAICARDMLSRGELNSAKVVTTVMSNIGLGVALTAMGIEHLKSQVGDRYVMEEMRKAGAVLGGEDSGHMIFLNHHTTGDGMLAALKLLETMRSAGRPLSELATIMTVFPQCLINVDVQSKPKIDTVHAVMQAIENVETQLGKRGRVLVRYSGTQPKCRVMVEGPSEKETNALCQKIASVVAEELG